MSPAEPRDKRAIVFVDGQNLFHVAREAFGHTYPNYDVLALARRICETKGWTLTQVRFYTGIPDLADDPFWHRFWEAKLRAIDCSTGGSSGGTPRSFSSATARSS